MTLADKVATFAADVPDWAVADALNAPDASLPSKTVDVAVSAARALLITRGAWGKISMGAEDAQLDPEIRALCLTARDSLLHLTVIEMTKPETAQSVTMMAAALLACNLVDQATHDDLMALGSAPQSWAELNTMRVDARQVGLARGSK